MQIIREFAEEGAVKVFSHRLTAWAETDNGREIRRFCQIPTTHVVCTVLVLRMADRKWKETKQQPSMLPGPAVPGSCLVSFHFLCHILSTSTVKQLRQNRQVIEVMTYDGPLKSVAFSAALMGRFTRQQGCLVNHTEIHTQ